MGDDDNINEWKVQPAQSQENKQTEKESVLKNKKIK
jgi:hypothetical protein